MTGLTEGADYYIRVIAVNDAGPGAPGVTEPVTVTEPQGRDSFIVVTETLLHFNLMYFCLILFNPSLTSLVIHILQRLLLWNLMLL